MFSTPSSALRRLAYQGLLCQAGSEVTSGMACQFRREFRSVWKTGWLQLQPYLAGLSLIVALMSIACASIFVVIAEETMGPGTIAFDRLLIAGIVFTLWRQLTSPAENMPSPKPAENGVSGQMWGLFIVAGASFAGSLGCAAWSLTQTTVANSTLLNNLMPLFTTLGAWILLGQRFNPRFLIGLGVALAGVITIGLQDLQMASAQLVGDGVALLAAIFLAATLLCIERLRMRYSTATTMAGLSLIGAGCLLPVALAGSSQIFPDDSQSGLAVVGLALISQVLGHGLLAFSLRTLSSSLVSVLMLAIPVMSALLAAALFEQHLGWISGGAFGVVLGGIYLAISSQTDEAPQDSAARASLAGHQSSF